jgi:hypothetical protein
VTAQLVKQLVADGLLSAAMRNASQSGGRERRASAPCLAEMNYRTPKADASCSTSRC